MRSLGTAYTASKFSAIGGNGVVHNPPRKPFVQKYQPATCNNGKATVLQAFRSIPDNAGKKFHHSDKATFKGILP